MKILFSSDSVFTNTGYSLQSKQLAKRLVKDGFDIDYLSWQFMGESVDHPDGYKVLGNRFNSPYGIDAFDSIFKAKEYDGMYSLGDIYMLSQLRGKAHPFLVGYFPIDGTDPTEYLFQQVSRYDVPVAMSEFGREMLKEYVPKTHYIPHSVDSSIFYPNRKNALDEREKLGLTEDDFLIGSVMRLNPRKRPERLLMAFKKFSDGKDNVKLYLHTDMNDPLWGGNHISIPYLIDLLDLKEKIIWSEKMTMEKGIPIKELALRYNCMDMHILSTSGEGFGLITPEAMACGVPCVLPNNTTGPEFLGDGRGILADIENDRIPIENKTIVEFWSHVSIDSLAEGMEKLYENKQLRQSMGRKSAKYAKEIYSWETNYPRWLKIFSSINSNMRFLR